jgi:1,4-alpha-glucan branching enzyme
MTRRPGPGTPEGVRVGARAGADAAAAGSGAPVAVPAPAPPAGEVQRLLRGEHAEPHALLGAHPASVDGIAGITVRAWHPNAQGCDAVLVDAAGAELGTVTLGTEAPGLFAAFLPGETLPLRYRLRFTFANGGDWETLDPYRFLPTLGEVDLHLFHEGTHRRVYEKLGAHVRTVDGVAGVAFAVWAPNARRVSVVGPWCQWDGRRFPMRRLGGGGVWELFVPGIGAGAEYEYELLTREGALRRKTDPFAFQMRQAPATQSVVAAEGTYAWGDDAWMTARPARDVTREPMAIYECHLGSWLRDAHDPGRVLGYREVAPRLAAHVRALGFTHIEFMPLAEHPFYGSWGYQVTGFYAPTARYGGPDDLRFLIDTLHQAGIGVILDWVPAHFPKDDYALRRFDGTALFEHEDPRLGEHPDWGTLIFNYGRHEVRSFLLANALYWLREFHVDGLRVDAVASMLYLDYSRKPDQWLRNRYGGRENLEAIDFLREVNAAVRQECPGCFTAAEESTAWPKVSGPPAEGGLGFTFKWNMGWMHDTLEYFAQNPVHRRYHHDRLTFAMMYEYSERFVMPLSHDEVVHLKGSLLTKMPGDYWQRLANLRALLAYQYTRPGKKLVFMGTELAPWGEWNHDVGLPWESAAEPMRGAFMAFVRDLGAVYGAYPAFWRHDHEPHGFQWIDVGDRDQSIVSYVRRDGDDHVLVVLNLTPVPRERYRVGAPAGCGYVVALSSDEARYGGSGYGGIAEGTRFECTPVSYHGHGHSVELTLPPLGALVLVPDRVADAGADAATAETAVEAAPAAVQAAPAAAPTDHTAVTEVPAPAERQRPRTRRAARSEQ